MTNAQTLAMQLSVGNSAGRLNEISGLWTGDAFTDEVRQESEDKLKLPSTGTSRNQVRGTNRRWCAEGDDAHKAGSQFGAGDSTEDRAYRELTGRANVGRMIMAVMEHRAADGADGELQKHLGLAPNQIPLDLLRAPVDEHRAVTPSLTNVGTQEQTVLQPVFAQGVGAFLSIDRPTVAMGDAVYPVLKTRPTVGGPHADSTDVPETTGGFDADLIAPARVQASFIHKRTDAARFAGLDSSLRMALNAGLEEKLDYEAIAGDEGLLHGSNLANNTSNATAAFGDYLSRFCYARVDGRYAAQTTDVRAVVGLPTYAHMGVSYRSRQCRFYGSGLAGEKDGRRSRVSACAGRGSNKQNAVVRLGSRRDMVQPVWAGVTIIVDEVTLSGKGEIEITAVLLMNTKILRVEGFHKQQSLLV